MNKKSQKAVDFQEYLDKQLKNQTVKKYYDEYNKQKVAEIFKCQLKAEFVK